MGPGKAKEAPCPDSLRCDLMYSNHPRHCQKNKGKEGGKVERSGVRVPEEKGP